MTGKSAPDLSLEAILSRVDQRLRARLLHPEARCLFTWHVGRQCGFRCPYCLLLWDEMGAQDLPLERAIGAWRRWYERHGRAQVCCTGAEPMFEGVGLQAIAAITEWHVLNITSNMAFPERALDGFADPSRVFFTASYHPEPRAGKRQNVESFCRRMRRVQARGFGVVGASCVAYPPLVDGLAEAKRRIEADGLWFSVHLFRGHYEGRAYPEAYTEDELSRIMDVIGPDASPTPVSMKGKPCWTGCKYLLVHADGSAHRCARMLPGQQPIGNFYDGTAEPYALPEPCPYEATCACQELWAYHASDEEAAAARTLTARATPCMERA